ncbi:MAG: carbohydrate ABC transporter permease [Chloroflexi bacterium]|nr:MAG: carbohydrate ABC transporter permease [Chloroflexota bacterium]
MIEQRTPSFWAKRTVIYALLTFAGFLMIFPFLFMLFTSFKSSDDVFRFPPRLLPFSNITREYQGEQAPLYNFEIDGETRQLVLTDEKRPFGFFTTPEKINVDSPRESEIVLRAPIDEVVDLEQEIILTDGAGNEDDFDLYEVVVDGEVREMVLTYRSSLDKFVDPDDPSVVRYDVARTANPVEQIEFHIDNYDEVVNLNNLNRALINTTLVTVGVTAGQLFTSILGGYAFSRIQFKGRDQLFMLYLGSIMIPFVVLIVPMYRLMLELGWQNHLVSLVVPWIFTAYGTFLMRQFFITIPREIEEAALLDGSSRWRTLWTIFVPLSKPVIATQTIFSFLYAWNSFIWPLLVINTGNEDNHVLTLALITLSNIAADEPNLVMTGAAVAIIPPMIIFVLAQKYFIEGVATSGLKG